MVYSIQPLPMVFPYCKLFSSDCKIVLDFLKPVGVAFLKAVPEGTYDAVIVDSSDPIGNELHNECSTCI